MVFYFTRSKKIGSRIIQWGLDDDCSHFAFGFFGNHDFSLIIESTMGGGFHIGWLKDFKKRNIISHALELDLHHKIEDEQYKHICNILHNSKYDYKGVLFWSLIALRYKMNLISKDEMDGFNNRWADRNSIFCVEVLKAQRVMLETIGVDTSFLDRQNIRPHRAYQLLSDTGRFNKVM